MSQIRKFALGAISACVVAMAPMAAKAETIQLGFILDSSGSITAGGWTTIKSGLANAMDLLLTGSDTYEVSVVSFSNSATTVVAPTIIDAGSIAGVKALINGAAFLNSVTNYAAAFSLMQTTLTGSTNFSKDGKSYVNFATDGVQNQGGTGVAQRDALIAAGIDNISIEGIGSGIDKVDLKTNFCYPGPCTEAPDPFNFPTKGFYIGVANAAGYAAAIGNKIRIVTNQTPEPGTIALAGLALVGLGLARRRKTA